MSITISRRDALRISGAALGAAALGGTARASWNELSPPPGLTQVNTLFKQLKPFHPGSYPAAGEMRISFLGTSVIERRAQVRCSIFVELGNAQKDSFVFDLGSGAVSNFVAMNVPWSRMRRIFFTHLHGDHTSDLTHVYCFGPQGDAKRPLFIWGPSASLVPNPDYDPKDPTSNPRNQYINPPMYDDGTIMFAQHFREMNRWHTESQMFVPTQWQGTSGDGYDLYATELDWSPSGSGGTSYWCTNTMLNPGNVGFATGSWIAYQANGVKISWFPTIHGRNGSVGYRLDWTPDGSTDTLSMIFTGDSKPNDCLLTAASAGSQPVDVLISELVVDPEIWVSRQSGLTDPSSATFQAGLVNAQAVQENSHTPQKALGYMLKTLGKMAPRLAVATHFQATDDTIALALDDIRPFYDGPLAFASDLMVISVTNRAIEQYRAVVPDYGWSARWAEQYTEALPKYKDTRECNPYAPSAPLAQFSPVLLSHVVNPCLYDPGGFQCVNEQKELTCPPVTAP